MRWCSVCHKGFSKGEGNLFTVPKEEDARTKWSVICGKRFKPNSLVCSDHFAPTSVVRVGKRVSLLPNTDPFVGQVQEMEVSINEISETSNAEENNNVSSEDFTRLFNLNNNFLPPQLKEEPIMQMPVIKSVSCTGYTQTNTRFCGLVQVSDFGDEFRFNCFYCSELFPLEKWQQFINHLKNNHFEAEEAFKFSKFISKDHDYTPMCIPSSNSKEDELETVGAKSLLPILMDPLEPANNALESVVLNSTFTSNENRTISNDVDIINNFIETNNPSVSGETTELEGYFKNLTNNSTKMILNKNKMQTNSKQTSKETILTQCLKSTDVDGMEAKDKENDKSLSIERVKPTEITFEYTPRDIVDLLLDSMANYPVLWQFNDVPSNKDFYDAVEDLCKIINDKWSLNIDNLKMRRSINRIFRFYCYLYPNANIENIDQFTCYYDKCAVFLPSSVNEIAYARCSHCYLCYRNDFELKRHLLEEQKYLQWPYKCVQCKECFRENDEYEFHKSLSHYTEIFRCEPCNKKFVRRNKYNRHIVLYHPKDSNERGKYVCDICGKAFRISTSLRNHKVIHEERKFKCHLCSKSYFTNAKLKLHIKSHRNEYDFICEVCGKGFIIQKGLMEHMKKHTGAKVTCSICNLRLRKSSLMRHLRLVHVAFGGNGETISSRKNHYYMRLIKSKPLRPVQRTGERKYNCKICNINFENYKSIAEHNKELHSDIPKWPCKMCSTEFNLKLNLKRHYRRKHKLHVIQVFKLVDENEDLNVVLAMDAEELVKLTKRPVRPKRDSDSETQPTNNSSIMSDNIFFEEESVHTSTIQDEIMKVADNIETHEIKIDYMNDFFTDLLKAEN